MDRHIDEEIRQLKEYLLKMGGRVESAIEHAIQALIQREASGFKKVYSLEGEINTAQMRVDELCLRIMARQAPLAADLRFIIAVIKINTDLERMGDQAVNISRNGERYIEHGPIKPLVDLPKMATAVQKMVRDSLDALVKHDAELAESVLKQDDIVDDYKDKIFTELKGMIVQKPEIVEPALDLMLIARNLERLGDHATNIAEEVIFAVSGQDVRHGGSGT